MNGKTLSDCRGGLSRHFRWLVVLTGMAIADPIAAQYASLQGVTQVDAGRNHACAVVGDGRAYCWGSNSDGELGRGFSGMNQKVPEPVALVTDFVQVSAGGRHSCGLTSTGGVKCWGYGGTGALGHGAFTDSVVPVDVVSLGGSATMVVAGFQHSCAVVGGGVKCWGFNGEGQLGDGGGSNSAIPVDVTGITSAGLLASSEFFTCALIGGGGIRCWGFNGAAQLGDGTTINRPTPVDVLVTPGGAALTGATFVSTGESHACATMGNQTVQCWGVNGDGRIGDGTTTNRTTPVTVSGLTQAIKAVAGLSHTCALIAGGTVKCWGENFYGNNGTGEFSGVGTSTSAVAHLTPMDVVGTNDAASLTAGGDFTCLRNTDSEVLCWGYSKRGRLGGDDEGIYGLPVDVVGLGSSVSEISTRGSHACALENGNVRCWGANHFGDLGDGTTAPRQAPTLVSSLGTATAVATGYLHSCALVAGGGVKCWGYNSLGSLGDNTTVDKPIPVDVLDASGLSPLTGISQISTGGSHSCALAAGGVKCWGNRSFGRLGNNAAGGGAQPLPVDVQVPGGGAPLGGIVQVALGQNHSCARSAASGVYCWGRGDLGQQGNGATAHALVPVVVLDSAGASALTDIAAIAVGAQHACALSGAGAVQCWGENTKGQLGNGSTLNSSLPVNVTGLGSNVVGISAGANHSCALRSNGDVQCWGGNDEQQLGLGDDGDLLAPGPVTARNVLQVAAGYLQTCAIFAGGAAKCWGDNQFGGLGNGGKNFAVPARVMEFIVPRQVDSLTPAGNNASLAPASDASGRYVTFQSDASNLIGADSNGGSDVFLLDRETGIATRISVNDDESELGSGGAIEPSVSGDGTLALFVAPNAAFTKLHGESKRTTASLAKQGGHGVFMRNLVAGTTQRMGGTQAGVGGGAGTQPVVSPDGLSIVFTGPNTDPALGQVGQVNVFRQELERIGNQVLPKPNSLVCVSCKSRSLVGAELGDADGESRNARISGNGTYIVYETLAKNAIDGSPSPCQGASNAAIILRNLITGSTQRMSPPTSLVPLNCGSSGSTAPSIDWAGGVIAFTSDQPLKPGSLPGTPNVFVAVPGGGSYERMSETPDGTIADGGSTQAVVSGDGGTVAFVSAATNLDPAFLDTNAVADIHARRRFLSVAERLSRGADGQQANNAGNRPALNYNGTFMAFDSAASNLVPTDANGSVVDVFQRVLPANFERVFGTGFE